MKKTKMNLMPEFLRTFQYSTIAEGWMSRKYGLVALAVNITAWSPEHPTFDDVEQYAKTKLETIVKMLKEVKNNG